MEKNLEQQDMRKAKRLAWICVALVAAALVAEVIGKALYLAMSFVSPRGQPIIRLIQYAIPQAWREFGQMAYPFRALPVALGAYQLNYIQTPMAAYLSWSPNLLMLLLPAAFFCWFQKGYAKRQLALLLIPFALLLYQVAGAIALAVRFGGPVFDDGFAGIVSLSSCKTIHYAVPFLLEAVLILLLCAGLSRQNRSLLRACGIAFVILAVLTPVISGTLMARLNIRMMLNNLFYIWGVSAWPVYKVSTSIIYALIAYRGVVVDDIALPGYPMRAAKPADPALRAASNPTVQGGQAVMGTKSKVAAALLAFFLGTTGAHRYYLGYKKQGIIQTCGFVSLILGWMFYVPAMMNESAGMMLLAGLLLLYGSVVGIWAFVDFIRILIGSLAPADGSGYAAQQAQAAQPAPAPSSGLDDLEKLAKLRDSGVLTEEEFQSKKADILARL